MSLAEVSLKECPRGTRHEPRSPGDFAHVVVAWTVLAMVDGVLKVAGFNGVMRLLSRRTSQTSDGGPNLEQVSVTCAAIDRARIYYFKRAWCLQSAAAAVCLLRAKGVAAELVVGVRRMPFLAHAWVEVNGRVVMNELPRQRALYTEIARG